MPHELPLHQVGPSPSGRAKTRILSKGLCFGSKCGETDGARTFLTEGGTGAKPVGDQGMPHLRR